MIRVLLLVLSVFYINIGLAAPGAHGPDGEHLSNEPATGNSQLGRQADGSVILPMPDQVMLDIRTRFVTTETVKARAKLSAVVRPHAQGHAVIQPSSDGRLQATDEGVPLSGTRVSAGEILGSISYQDSAYEQASQTGELLSIRNEIVQTRRDVKRLQEMGELASQQALEQLQTRLKSLSEQEVQLSKGLEQPQQLVAPISGLLINHQVSNGQWVEAGTTLFEIVAANMRQIDAVTHDASLLRQLSTAVIADRPEMELTYMGYSPRLLAGMITLHFEYRDEREIAEPLMIGQPVTLLAAMENEINGIVLPAGSVVMNSANLPIVWIKVSARRFMSQVVEYQQLGAGKVVITKGLGADNRVVVAGTSLLNQVR